jgi:hypothetical protein
MPAGQAVYAISVTVLSSKHNSVPQNREQVSVVRRQHDKVITDPDVFNFGTVHSTEVTKTNLNMAHTALVAEGIQPCSVDVVVDVGSGQGLNMVHKMCTTTTHTRGQNPLYYMMSVACQLTAFELCHLKGVEPFAHIGPMAGNARTALVLAHVIRDALLTIGLARCMGRQLFSIRPSQSVGSYTYGLQTFDRPSIAQGSPCTCCL